jgi:parallel beta-helix repeat protein
MRKEQLAYMSTALLLILAFSVFVAPIRAFINPNGTQNSNYELYGPHLNEILVSEYVTPQDEFTAMYNGGGTPGFDVGDWPLTPTWISTFSSDPYVDVLNAGGMNSYYIINFNLDNEYDVPNSDRSPYKNPAWNDPTPGDTVYPNGIPPITTNVYFRIACRDLFNYSYYSNFLGIGGSVILTPIPAYMGLESTDWIDPSITTPVCSPAQAVIDLYAGHIYNYTNPSSPSTSPSAWYWDYQNIGPHVPTGTEVEAANLEMTAREDVNRMEAGNMLYTALMGLGFTFNVVGTHYGYKYVTGTDNYEIVMITKNYLITTLGWGSVGPSPDYLYSIYNGANFWDSASSSCPNTADLNDPTINNESYWIHTAPNISVAYEATIAFQQRFQEIAAEIPLYSPTFYMAVSKTYVGTEDSYGGQSWLGMANSPSIGPDCWFTFLNAHAANSLYGTSLNPEVMRWGWSVESYPQTLNALYPESVWDYDILGEIYDSPGYLDPYNLVTWHGDLIENWTVGTWKDPVTNVVKSEVTMTLRPDVYWSDGVPMTMADVVFSIVDLGPLLVSEGLPPPWWWPTAETIQSVDVKDPYTVSLLFDVQSTWAEGWALGGFYIVPEHVWEPLILGYPTTNASGFAPDPNMVGSGPFRYVSYASTGLSLVLAANSPGSTVTTDQPGAVPTTSTYGYHNYCPVGLYVNTLAGTGPGGSWSDYATKIPINQSTDTVNIPIEVTLFSKLSNSSGTFTALTGLKNVTFDGTPLATNVPETLPGNPSPENPVTPAIELFTLSNVGKGLHTVTATFVVTGPATVPDLGTTTQANPWVGQVITATLRIYVGAPALTSTSINLSVNQVYVGSPVTCTATVSGVNATGTITWSTSSSTGSFSAPVCTLSSAGSCSTTYVDGCPGSVTIAAYYSGDSYNLPSSGSTTLIVISNASVYYSANFSSVQDAIDAATPGSNVIVAPGTYHGCLILNKTLTIIGERDTPGWGGGGSGIYLTVLSGASGSIVTGVQITSYDEGILVYAGNCRIYGNSMSSMGEAGIVLEGSNATGNIIYDNSFQDTPTPINLTASAGGNSVYDNIISSQATVTLSVGANGNSIYQNAISGSSIVLNMTNSQGNTLYHNDFFASVQIVAAGTNTWDNGYPSGGNYWSDYQTKYPGATQNDSLSIWNMAYVIDSNNKDNYPLMKPYALTVGHDVAITGVVTGQTLIDQGLIDTVTVTAANKGQYNETFEVTAYASGTVIGTQQVTNLGSANQVTLTFTWNTTGLVGTYTISAYATPVSGETNLADNTFVDGTVQIISGGSGGRVPYMD